MENKSTGKTVLIVVLLLAVIGLGGYIAYDKTSIQSTNDREIQTLKNQINKLKKENKKLESSIEENVSDDSSQTTTTNCAKYIDATFYGENVGNGFSYKETLKLYSNGSFEDSYENGSGTVGTYVIENGKITLTSPGGAMYDAYTNTYDITNNCKTINKNSDISTLTRQ